MSNVETQKLYTKLKADHLQYRKDKNTLASILLSCVIGDIDNKADRTDSSVIAIIKKHIKNNDQVISLCDSEQLRQENLILERYLPKPLSLDEIKFYLDDYINTTSDKTKKGVMSYFKENFFSRYDPKLLMSLFEQL